MTLLIIHPGSISNSTQCKLVDSSQPFHSSPPPTLSLFRTPWPAEFPDLVGKLDRLGLAVGLTSVDLLAGLLDGAEDGLIVEPGLGDHQGLLLIERDVVALDACETERHATDQPSSLFIWGGKGDTWSG